MWDCGRLFVSISLFEFSAFVVCGVWWLIVLLLYGVILVGVIMYSYCLFSGCLLMVLRIVGFGLGCFGGGSTVDCALLVGRLMWCGCFGLY